MKSLSHPFYFWNLPDQIDFIMLNIESQLFPYI